jgi:hypothetical protein
MLICMHILTCTRTHSLFHIYVLIAASGPLKATPLVPPGSLEMGLGRVEMTVHGLPHTPKTVTSVGGEMRARGVAVPVGTAGQESEGMGSWLNESLIVRRSGRT